MELNPQPLINLLNSHYERLDKADAELAKPEVVQDPQYLARIEASITTIFEQISSLHKALEQLPKKDEHTEVSSVLRNVEQKVSKIKKVLVEKHQQVNRAGQVAQQLLSGIEHHYQEETASEDTGEAEVIYVAAEVEDKEKPAGIEKPPQMVGVRTGYKTGLTREQMDQLVRKTFAAVAASSLEDFETRMVEVNEGSVNLLVGKKEGHQIMAVIAPNVDNTNLKHLLGSGNYGLVFGGHSLTDDERLALKIPHPQMDTSLISPEDSELIDMEDAKKEVLKGFANALAKSQYIERHGGLPGVAVIRLLKATTWGPTSDEAPESGGVLAVSQRGTCNLKEKSEALQDMPLREKLEASGSLFEALAFFEEHGLIHGDICTENIVFIEEPEKQPRLAFIDLDGSRFLDELDINQKLEFDGVGTAYRVAYMPAWASKSLQAALAAKDPEAYKKAQLDRQLYCLGQCLTVGLRKGNKLIDDIRDLDESAPKQEIINLFKAMTTDNPDLTAAQALKQYKDLMAQWPS